MAEIKVEQFGTVHTDPATGERVITVGNVRKPADGSDVVRVTLWDILGGGTVIASADTGTRLRLKPISLYTLGKVDVVFRNKTLSELDTQKTVACIIANDSRAEGAPIMTQDDFDKAVDVEMLPVVNVLIQELLRPLFRLSGKTMEQAVMERMLSEGTMKMDPAGNLSFSTSGSTATKTPTP